MMVDIRIPPLNQNSPIVDDKGKPTTDFLLLVNQLLKQVIENAGVDAAAALAAAQVAQIGVDFLNEVDVIAGIALGGGGKLGDGDLTIDLEDTAVVPGTYGSGVRSVVVTVDQQGRITDITTAVISGGGGGGGIYAPLVNGDLPGPVPIATDDGQFLMVELGQ